LSETIRKVLPLQLRESPEEISAHFAKYSGADLGAIRLDMSMIRRKLHPIEVYNNLLSLLTADDLATLFLLGDHPKEKGCFATILVKIFDSQGQLIRFIKALTDHEIENTPNPDIIFRGNSMVTKSLDSLMKFVGSSYLNDVLAPFLSELCSKKTKSYEVDPAKADKKQNISKNASTLISICGNMLSTIYASVGECPPVMAIVFSNIRAKVQETYHEEQIGIVKYTSVSAFIFLRFFCPAILNPKLFGFVAKLAPSPARTCTLLTKLAQNLANLVTFADKEPYMNCFNKFITDNIPRMKEFIDKLCAKGEREKGNFVHPSQETWLEKELAMAAIHIRNCQSGWYSEDNVVATDLASELETIYALDKDAGDESMAL